MKTVMSAAAALLLATAPVLAADSTAGSDSGMHPQSTQKPIPGAAGKSTNSDGSSVSSGTNGSSTGPGGTDTSSGPNPDAVKSPAKYSSRDLHDGPRGSGALFRFGRATLR